MARNLTLKTAVELSTASITNSTQMKHVQASPGAREMLSHQSVPRATGCLQQGPQQARLVLPMVGFILPQASDQHNSNHSFCTHIPPATLLPTLPDMPLLV